MALAKIKVVEQSAERNNLNPTKAKQALEEILEIMKSTLASGEDLMISGFGKFCVNDKAPKKGRNPATGKDMTLEARKVVTFRVAGKLRDRINGNS